MHYQKNELIVLFSFSLLLKDLYFLNEGCANKLSNGHINMEKVRHDIFLKVFVKQ